jgi:tRNA pseudouridine13 synthase
MERWLRAALGPPRAHGAALPIVEFKATPEDFRVEEQLSFVPSGDGPHWLLRVEKTGSNTQWVAAALGRLAGVPVHDVGYAGLKDRQAITVQWFSVPALATPIEYWNSVHAAEFKVLEAVRNTRKLKRGALTGNRFRIRLRNVTWSREELDRKLLALRAHGVPNYFGPQRFGRDGRNLERVAAWLDGRGPRGRSERGFSLSAARSLIFNALLARRVQAGDWLQLAPGDLASLDGSGSHFRVTSVDAALLSRLAAFDVHPSGPMWGRGHPQTTGLALQHETAVGDEFGDVAKLLDTEGLAQERRALRCAVRELAVEAEAGVEAGAGTVTFSFMLGRGQFATSVVREICELGPVAGLLTDEGMGSDHS